jgi:arylsulfatase A-like enzyme
MPVPRPLSTAFAALLVAVSCACSRDPQGAPAAVRATRERPSVLLIAIDTLRADRLGCQGNRRGLTPKLDALAAEGVRFDHAFSHAPWTLPSFSSIFTSLLPEEHGAGGNVSQGFRGLAERFETWPERLRDCGWTTHAIVNVDFLGPNFGATQGFTTIDASFSENNREMRDARATTDAALAWLGAHGEKPFVLFVHYFDPHAEYAPPQPWRARFAAPEDQQSTAFEFGRRDQVVGHRAGVQRLPEAAIRRAEQLYDGEVAYTDSEIGRLLEALDASGRAETTLVLVTADHGEEFFDHGDYEHGHTLYDELLHVPWILRQKGRLGPRTITAPVGLVDLGPTVCGLLGIAPRARLAGHDRSAAVLGTREASAAPLLAYGSFWGAPLESLRDAEYKLIKRPEPGGKERLELYHWSVDPREQDDLAARDATRRDRMRQDLALLGEVLGKKGAGAGTKVVLPPQEEARLRALGYIGGDDDDPHEDGN